ncbi:MAG TPA: hypothetical protein VHX37_03220 [Acidobacteriaceae bacterium]|jgi:hypothetical protein|nr:hypothetical protein [Acidobacteriaceae bacterium]
MNNGTSAQSTTVLTSWKDIARYMGKGVRTVQRWEQDFGLPVRRPQGSNKKAVLARPRDLDAWVALRCSSRAQLATSAVVLTSDNGVPPPKPAYDHLRTLTAIQCGIETHRQLQINIRSLIGEVHTALDTLRTQIITISGNR